MCHEAILSFDLVDKCLSNEDIVLGKFRVGIDEQFEDPFEFEFLAISVISSYITLKIM